MPGCFFTLLFFSLDLLKTNNIIADTARVYHQQPAEYLNHTHIFTGVAMSLPSVPTSSDLDAWFFGAIREKPVSNGLAILIGCTRSYRKDQKPLQGVSRDLDSLEKTCKHLMFAVLCLKDPSSEQIKKVIKHVSRFDKEGLRLPPSWKRIIVTFSGHGERLGERSCLCAKDDSVDIQADIVDPLLPVNAKHVAQLPKLFFIDACRGDKQDDGMEIVVWPPSQPEGFQARGSPRVSSKGNYLLACSTLIDYQSFEDPNFGGIWMQLLCAGLVDANNIDKSIYDVLTEVNGKMEKWCNENNQPVQQPILQSALNEEIKLLKEAQGIAVYCSLLYFSL